MRKITKKLLISFLSMALVLPNCYIPAYANELPEQMAAEMTEQEIKDEVTVPEDNMKAAAVAKEGEEIATTGTLGDNGGFTWTYDENTETLTITGEDRGLQWLRHDIPKAISYNMKEVVFQDCVAKGSLDSMFRSCDQIISVDFSGLDTSGVYDMGYLFHHCTNLTNVNMSGFDTSNVNIMYYMFYGCESLTELDVSGFDTSKATYMSGMFYGCKSLTELDVSGFDTSNVKDMENMFVACGVSELDVSGFDTSKVEDMGDMFSGCNNLTSVDTSGFNMSNAEYLDGMFSGCSSLTNVKIGKLGTSVLRSLNNMFENCSSLTSVDLSGLDMSQAEEMKYVFTGCDSLMTIKTPKALHKKHSIKLPVAFVDAQNNTVNKITSEHCNKTLTKVTEKVYDITYNLNGGKNNADNPATYTKSSETIKLKTPTKTGYTFSGWYSDSKFGKKVTSISNGSKGDKTLYAKWTPNKYDIAFKGNGSTSGSMKKMSDRKYGSKYTLTNNAFQKKGYTFTGWNTKADGSGTAYKNKENIKNLTTKKDGTVTLYAQWKINSYDITYKLNGGKNNGENPKEYTVNTATITLKAPTKEGYKFVGWYSNKKLTKKVTKITKGSTGDKTLYAKWKKK